MHVKFASAGLEKLAAEANFTGGYEPEVVNAFRQRLQLLRAAPTEVALLPLRALGMRRVAASENSYVMRVSDEFGLRMEFDGGELERRAVVNALTPYDDKQ